MPRSTVSHLPLRHPRRRRPPARQMTPAFPPLRNGCPSRDPRRLLPLLSRPLLPANRGPMTTRKPQQRFVWFPNSEGLYPFLTCVCNRPPPPPLRTRTTASTGSNATAGAIGRAETGAAEAEAVVSGAVGEDAAMVVVAVVAEWATGGVVGTRSPRCLRLSRRVWFDSCPSGLEAMICASIQRRPMTPTSVDTPCFLSNVL